MKTPNQLLELASEAFEKAYAPYSNYQVGAALQCEDGTIITGCNVENASYGLSNCAERTAIFSAISQGHTRFTGLAIAASSSPAPFPCGACRQVLIEFCPPELPVYIQSDEGVEKTTLGELLPHSFKRGPEERL